MSVAPEMAVPAERGLPQSMVERMTLIIDAFDGPTTYLMLEEISRRTHLPRSTVHRILHQLVGLQWIDSTPHGFRLGRRILGDAIRGEGHQELRAAAAPHLYELLMHTGAVVHLAVLDDDRVSYLDKIGGPFARSVPSQVGGSQPAHRTALGKSILAYYDPMAVDEAVGLGPTLGNEPSDHDFLHADLYRVRTRGGIAFERGQSFPGVACVAAPVRIDRVPVAAISISVPAEKQLERLAPLALAAASATAEALQPRYSPCRSLHAV